jgi:hypothetical protein
MNDIFKGIGMFTVAVFIVAAISILLSWPAYMLWNGCLVGAVDGVHHVTWLQSFGIVVLFNILFKTASTKSKD